MSTTKQLRVTIQMLKVLTVFLDHHPEAISGADVFNRTKLFSGTLYPILSRLESAGWLRGEWESIDPSEAGRPRRKFYRLTSVGRQRALQELRALEHVTGRARPVDGKAVGAG
jgi:PadR family transcriptional regulator, regulatory protein PadR